MTSPLTLSQAVILFTRLIEEGFDFGYAIALCNSETKYKVLQKPQFFIPEDPNKTIGGFHLAVLNSNEEIVCYVNFSGFVDDFTNPKKQSEAVTAPEKVEPLDINGIVNSAKNMAHVLYKQDMLVMFPVAKKGQKPKKEKVVYSGTPFILFVTSSHLLTFNSLVELIVKTTYQKSSLAVKDYARRSRCDIEFVCDGNRLYLFDALTEQPCFTQVPEIIKHFGETVKVAQLGERDGKPALHDISTTMSEFVESSWDLNPSNLTIASYPARTTIDASLRAAIDETKVLHGTFGTVYKGILTKEHYLKILRLIARGFPLRAKAFVTFFPPQVAFFEISRIIQYLCVSFRLPQVMAEDINRRNPSKV